jgi:hypothetical protein
MMIMGNDGCTTIRGSRKSSSPQTSEKIDIEDYIPSEWRQYRVW